MRFVFIHVYLVFVEFEMKSCLCDMLVLDLVIFSEFSHTQRRSLN